MSRAAYNENLDILDEMAVKKGEGIAELVGGTLTERPEPEIPGRYYFAQDKGEIWLDTVSVKYFTHGNHNVLMR